MANARNLFVFFLLLSLVLTGETLKRKIWNKNTNLNDFSNWVGYERNCSRNLYAFPTGMDPAVLSIRPNSTISAKQIILPRNGHLVFQKGSTVWFNSPAETCQGTELKFRQTTRADWFSFDNWKWDADSLLNSEAIPHVERVPCQYDSVQFPSESSFHLLISLDVVVAKFFLGEEELKYDEVAMLMSSRLGKIQFQKGPDTQISINPVDWRDGDGSICKNHQSPIRAKICSLGVKCPEVEGRCTNPILPHGFCCPICGYHLKVEHTGALALAPVRERVGARATELRLSSAVATYVGRYATKLAHLVFIPWMNKTKDVEKLVDEIRIFLNSNPTVTATTLSKSWDESSSASLASSGSNPGLTAFIVIFLILIVGITAFLIVLWKRGYPPITVTSIISRLPQLPRFVGGGGGDSPRPSFSFARFSNERISNVNIGATISAEVPPIEKVDPEANPIELIVPSGVSVPVSEIGLDNATYDLIGIQDEKPAPSSSLSAAKSFPEDENIYDVVDVNHDYEYPGIPHGKSGMEE